MSHQRKFASGKWEGLALASMMGVASLIASTGACSGSGGSNATAQQGATGQVGSPTACQTFDILATLPPSPSEDPDVTAVNAFIDATEAAAILQAQNPGALDAYHQELLIGKAEIYDKTLSVNKNLACASCHYAAAGFTGGVSLFNQTIVAQPGSAAVTNAVAPAPDIRLGPRKPQTYAYAPFAPILHYNATQQSFYGGNFWDMRATGTHLDNPAAEQAEGPPVNPVEMGMPDTACVVYRLSQTQYRTLFETVWGVQSFAITWPADIETVCSTPGPAPASNPLPVTLSATDRGTSNVTYNNMVLSMASYEAGPEVSPFSSKFDQFLAGSAQLTAQEQNGWSLFQGKAKCNQCHLDGTASGTTGQFTPADVAPLFTDFTANNIGVPNNPCLPYLQESKPDQLGFVANPAGTGFVDLGVGEFLAGNGAAPNPNPTVWGPLAP
ncbi:MAG: Cytochrome c peroxidase family protein [Myxococcaceae bacterium]|nr:Cytochrome c peroxidase family protein [Myxococcaceae bacterium]